MQRNIQGRRIHYRSFWLLGMLMVAMLGIASLFAIYTIRYAAESMEENLTITLSSNAKGKADTISLWLSNIEKDTKRFVDKDMIRLFCAESVIEAKGSREAINTVADDESTAKNELENVRSIILQQLNEFIETTEFTAGGIWDANLKSLLYTNDLEEKLTPDQEKIAKATLKSGLLNFSNIHSGLAGLMLTMSYPIFPPEYTDLPQDRPVATLLLEIPLEIPLNKMLANPDEEFEGSAPYRLFQWESTNNALEYIDLTTGELTILEGWETPRGKSLPLKNRVLPDGDFAYSRGIPIEGQNLLVSHEEPAHIAEDFYANFRNFMIAFVAGAVIITGMLLWGCWWFFVGRHERHVEANMRKLHEDVNTQQQILDSINATLADGVVLTDTLGNIRYSNASFAKMVHHSNENDILGFKMGNLLNPDVAELLQGHLDQVIETQEHISFETKLTIKNNEVFWQGIYTPYFGEREHISGVVAVFRDTTKMVEEREIEQNRIEQLIQVLTMSVGLVNPYLRGHSQLMGELAEHLGKMLGRTSEEQKTLQIAASLSQMGMISLPKELLNKKGALTDSEREIMQTHVTKTCEMLADFDFGLPVQETIAQMHENMDGTGYPNNLKGDEISMLARILHISNAFCAILRPRIYRKAKSLNDAILILNKERVMYDVRVLNTLKTFVISEEGKSFVNKLQQNILTN